MCALKANSQQVVRRCGEGSYCEIFKLKHIMCIGSMLLNIEGNHSQIHCAKQGAYMHVSIEGKDVSRDGGSDI
jgi:hypothetical protein